MYRLLIVAALVAAIHGLVPLSPCQHKQHQVDNQNPPMLGMFRPDCDKDGSYSAKQCHETVCYCADKQGNRIGDYETAPWQQANEMKCQCAREKESLKGLIGKWVNCDNIGNYKSQQCTGSVCYCVHPHTGLQISQGVGIWEMEKLNC